MAARTADHRLGYPSNYRCRPGVSRNRHRVVPDFCFRQEPHRSGHRDCLSYLRYPLSCQDVVHLLAERAILVDRSTIFRWVQKFSPELTRRTENHLRRASVDWHVDESCIRVGGKWRYLWRAVDANGQMIDLRLTARRDAKAAKAFLNKAIERVRLHRPVKICTDKAPAYRRVIRDINHRYDPHFDSIQHIDKKWRNNPIESDHAAMKRLLGYRQSFRSLRSAKATLSGIETIRTVKRGHIHNKQPGVEGEIQFISELFEAADHPTTPTTTRSRQINATVPELRTQYEN